MSRPSDARSKVNLTNQPTEPDPSDTYVDTFDARGDLYNAAATIQPKAREIERSRLIEMLELKPNLVVCDVPAGGGFLADGICQLTRQPENIFCVEPSKRFSEPVSGSYRLLNCPIGEIPVADQTFDRVGSLAGLHHVRDKIPFFSEVFRVLATGGLVAVADVLEGSPVAKFLNGPVDRYTESGHHGTFINTGDFPSWFQEVGLNTLREQYHQFCWTFDSESQMIEYCQNLFGLIKANHQQVREALFDHFEIKHSDGKTLLPWSLIYGVAQKSEDEETK